MDPLLIKLTPSRWQRILITMMAFVCFSSVLVVPIALGLKGILSCVVLWVFLDWLKREARFASENTVIRYTQKDGWSIVQADGTWLPVALNGQSMVHPWLTVLYFMQRPTSSAQAGVWHRCLMCLEAGLTRLYRRVPCPYTRCYVITPDCIEKDAFRALRVRLRWGRVLESN